MTAFNIIKVNERQRGWSDKPHARTRVYVTLKNELAAPDGPPCTDLECGSPTCDYARSSGHPENCEVDHKVWRAWQRKALLERKELFADVRLHDGTPLLDVVGALKFSRKAGCACGCSPGFIATMSYGKEIYIDAEVLASISWKAV